MSRAFRRRVRSPRGGTLGRPSGAPLSPPTGSTPREPAWQLIIDRLASSLGRIFCGSRGCGVSGSSQGPIACSVLVRLLTLRSRMERSYSRANWYIRQSMKRRVHPDSRGSVAAPLTCLG